MGEQNPTYEEAPVPSEPLTLMTVHAHPDDEVVFTGGLLARYAAEGIETVLVMCTNGEEGEIHDPDLDADEAKPRLGVIRRGELRCAIEHLNITHTEFLDYRDSGMAGTEPNANPACFHQADKDQAAARLVSLVRQYRPQVLVTYDENGSYGHPDHIAANVITQRAFDRAGDPDHAVGDTWDLWVSTDGSVVETTSPRTTWLALGIGFPLFVLLIGLMVRWRNRTMAKAVLAEADKIEARRTSS